MPGGITALEGFDYQTMVALEFILNHFSTDRREVRARPEGRDDLDLVHKRDGVVHRTHIQIKKPRQDASGLRTPRPWTLSEIVDHLIVPRWNELLEHHNQACWVLGDELDRDANALLDSADETATWAARHAAAEKVVRDRELARPLNGAKELVWSSPFRGGAWPTGPVAHVRARLSASFVKRATRAGFDAATVDQWMRAIEAAHDTLDAGLKRVVFHAPYAEAHVVRERLELRLANDYGLDINTVRDVVFRNLRGYVDDIARARGIWIEPAQLEDEIAKIWPRRVPTVIPPPLPRPHLPRPLWVRALADQPGSVVGPSGSGKTTSATELYEVLRADASDQLVLYAEVREDTTWTGVVEGVAHAVGRYGESAPYRLLPSIRAGEDEAMLSMADALEAATVSVALIVDLVEGIAAPIFVRDLARFVQRLPRSPRTRLWVFSQEDALSGLAEVEMLTRGLKYISVPGLDFEAFVEFADLHEFGADRGELYRIYQILSSGRTTGVAPRIADAILRLESIDEAVEIAASDRVLLDADVARYDRLASGARTALGALAALSHAFRVDDAQTLFPELAVPAAVHAGLRAGLLHLLGDGRIDFHETVRRNVLSQLSPLVSRSTHGLLADVYVERGDRVLEAHHAELAGQHERAREAGRAAFFDPITARRISMRAVARGWIKPAEALDCIRASETPSSGWWDAIEAKLDDTTATALLDWWREALAGNRHHPALYPVPHAVAAARPDFVQQMLNLIIGQSQQSINVQSGATFLGSALREHPVDETLVLNQFGLASPGERGALAPVLYSWGTPRCLARWLKWIVETDGAAPSYGQKHLTQAHVEALLEALPDIQPSALIVKGDWMFHTASSFLWRHREDLGEHLAVLLDDDGLEPRQACVALRLLGLIGHQSLFKAARRWSRKQTAALGTALVAPILVDSMGWRHHLESLAVDSTLESSFRIEAFGVHAMSSSDPRPLFERVVTVSPELEPLCRFMTASAFGIRPSLFALDMVIEQLGESEDDGILGSTLMRTTDFADGPDAKAVATRLLALLERPAPKLRYTVLFALTMLRQPTALAACSELAIAEAGNKLGELAAIAACASRPARLAEVRDALAAHPGLAWLWAALAARFSDADAVPKLVALARDRNRRWYERRRALLSLERLPPTPAVEIAISDIIDEPCLLGPHDSADGKISEMVAGLLLDDPRLLFDVWQRGEPFFIEVFAPGIRGSKPDVEAGLRAVWQEMSRAASSPFNGFDPHAHLADAVHLLQVQAAAITVARAHGYVSLLERVLAGHGSRWLVFHALVERTKVDPCTPEDVERWKQQIQQGPVGADRTLSTFVENVLPRSRQPQGDLSAVDMIKPPGAKPPPLTAEEILDLLSREQEPPAQTRIEELDEPQLNSIIAQLRPEDDSITEVIEPEASAGRVVLTAHSAVVRGRATRSRGRAGKRPQWRAYLCARYPDRVPRSWFEQPTSRASFVSALLDALADEGDPVNAREILSRLPDGLASFVRAGTPFYRLGRVADNTFVNWVANLAGSGDGGQIHALASFARAAKADAIIPLLSRLMRRIEGHLSVPGREISRDPQDPWHRALSDVLRAERLRDIPGTGAWLVRILLKTKWWWMRATIIDAMAGFPSTWSTIELEATKEWHFDHLHNQPFRKADSYAHAIFTREPR